MAAMPAPANSSDSAPPSVCPGCGALIPVLVEAPPAALSVGRGQVSGAGCRVHVSEAGLLTRLQIETPGGVIYHGREPGRLLTAKGATLLLAGPPVVLALAVAFGLLGAGVEPLPVVIALLVMALVLYLVARAGWKSRDDLSERAVVYAWDRLVPQLHEPKFSLEESAFLAGLARWSAGSGLAARQRESWRRALALTEQAAVEGRPVVRHLAALQRLAIAHAAAEADPILLLAAQIGRCFDARPAEGLTRMPPCFAEELLAPWRADWWNKTNLARLRLLVCDRAFEAGLEVRHLIEAGQLVPALANLLQTDDPAGLARLRLLWSLRASRPWDRCGPAVTAFEVAALPESSRVMTEYPDLLLYQTVPLARRRVGESKDAGPRGEVVVCGRGVAFQGVLFTELPVTLEVFSRGLFRRGGHRLVVGGHTFHLPDDPEPLARLLERWFHYHFREFLPQAADVADWQSPAGDAVLRTWGTVACPQCRRIVRVKPGEVGVALEEPVGPPAL